MPVTQTCEKGSTEWDQATKAGQAEPEHPAPTITLTAAAAGDDEHGTTASTESDEATATTASSSSTSVPADPDLVGRFLGLGGLLLGAVALVVSVAATRRRGTSK